MSQAEAESSTTEKNRLAIGNQIAELLRIRE